MKRGAILVNTSRAPLVDEAGADRGRAVEGRIVAALDVLRSRAAAAPIIR